MSSYIGFAKGRKVIGPVTAEQMEETKANPVYRFIEYWAELGPTANTELSPEVAATIRPAKAEAEQDKPKRRKKSED